MSVKTKTVFIKSKALIDKSAALSCVFQTFCVFLHSNHGMFFGEKFGIMEIKDYLCTPNNAYMLEVKNLHARIGEKEILKGIDLVINDGETHAITSHFCPAKLYLLLTDAL